MEGMLPRLIRVFVGSATGSAPQDTGRNPHGSVSLNRKEPRRSGPPRCTVLSVGYLVGLVGGILPVSTT